MEAAGSLSSTSSIHTMKAKMHMTNDKTTFADERPGTGTKEWSNFSYNICIGCEHGCLYCYAKAQACRFDKPKGIPGKWNQQKLNPTRRALGDEVEAKGVVMFPTSHDITPPFLRRSLLEFPLLHNSVPPA